MNKLIYEDVLKVIDYTIKNVLPNKAVKKALEKFEKPKGKTYMIAIGKASYSMALETVNTVKIDKGLVITKYGHSLGPIDNTTIIEAGHPVVDKNSIIGTNKAIELVKELNENDALIFLISGGGSALFEAPLISLEKLQTISTTLLRSDANIEEINTIRKRLSKVKGGKFAKLCPCKIFNIVLSDIINDPLDMIASGPTIVDNTKAKDALEIVKKYNLQLDEEVMVLLNNDGVDKLDNVETYVTGNNEIFRLSAKTILKQLGYETVYLDEPLTCDVNVAKNILLNKVDLSKNKLAIIAGGEVTVKVKGDGLGGRNQELALLIGKEFKDNNIGVLCLASDGTDGPTDLAGAYVDKDLINDELDEYLDNNDAYHYLEKFGGQIKTGPTNTNVCDLYCILINNN